MISSLIFYALAGLILVCAIGVVTLRNMFHCALLLTGALTLIAGIFVLLGGDFIASAQILIYVGGVMVIMLFVVMLSQNTSERFQRAGNDQRISALMVAGLIALALVNAFGIFHACQTQERTMVPTTAALGRLLLGDLVLPFEVVSLVILAALVGAVFFSEGKGENP